MTRARLQKHETLFNANKLMNLLMKHGLALSLVKYKIICMYFFLTLNDCETIGFTGKVSRFPLTQKTQRLEFLK